MKKNPYTVIQSRHVTEKAMTMSNLESSESNKSVARCKSPKAVFLVDPHATKAEIAIACEEIYREQNVKVTKVNTITNKPKKRRVRGRTGFKKGFKKAIVTFEPGDKIEEI